MVQPKPTLGFIGAGSVASALALALARAGYEVSGVASRRFESAQRLAERLPSTKALPSGQAVAERADLVFITTPDDAIEEAAAGIFWSDWNTVVHTSGALSRTVLDAAKRGGAHTGSLHPLQSFAGGPGDADRLRGTAFAVEAEGECRRTLQEIVAAVGGVGFDVRSQDKALYHTAAVLASNYTVTLMKLATDLWSRFGYNQGEALQALLPLLEGTVANLRASGLQEAITGPVARGDVATVKRNLQALSPERAALGEIYRLLALETIPIGFARGSLGVVRAAELRAAIEASRPPALPRACAERKSLP